MEQNATLSVTLAKIDELTEQYAQEAADRSANLPPDPLQPLASRQKKAAAEVRRAIKELQTSFQMGWQAIMQTLEDQQIEGAEEIGERELSSEGQLHLSDDFLDLLYRAALHLYNQREFEKAAAALTVCLSMNQEIYAFWFTLGAVYHASAAYQEALYAYTMAAGLDEDNPYPHLNLARVWVVFKEWGEAKEAVSLAEGLCKKSKEYGALIQECRLLSEKIEIGRKGEKNGQYLSC